MFGLGVQELLVILLIVLIFFGAEKIPQLAKSLGKGMSEFKKAQQDINEEINNEAGTTVSVAATVDKPTTVDKPAVISFTTCPHCNNRTVEDSLFCSQCGQRITGEVRCSLCQRKLQADEKFCPNCGSPREDSQEV